MKLVHANTDNDLLDAVYMHVSHYQLENKVAGPCKQLHKL